MNFIGWELRPGGIETSMVKCFAEIIFQSSTGNTALVCRDIATDVVNAANIACFMCPRPHYNTDIDIKRPRKLILGL